MQYQLSLIFRSYENKFNSGKRGTERLMQLARQKKLEVTFTISLKEID